MPDVEPRPTIQSGINPPTIELNAWGAVKFSLGWIFEAEQRAQNPAELLGHWDSAIRSFRFIENQQLIEKSPSPPDLKMHEALLHGFISLGQILEIRSSDQDLADFGIHRETLVAYIEELKDTLTMWHAPLPESVVAGLKDIEEGRVVDLDTALNQKPPGA